MNRGFPPKQQGGVVWSVLPVSQSKRRESEFPPTINKHPITAGEDCILASLECLSNSKLYYKQQLGISGFFREANTPWFLLFNNKKIEERRKRRCNQTRSLIPTQNRQHPDNFSDIYAIINFALAITVSSAAVRETGNLTEPSLFCRYSPHIPLGVRGLYPFPMPANVSHKLLTSAIESAL